LVLPPSHTWDKKIPWTSLTSHSTTKKVLLLEIHSTKLPTHATPGIMMHPNFSLRDKMLSFHKPNWCGKTRFSSPDMESRLTTPPCLTCKIKLNNSLMLNSTSKVFIHTPTSTTDWWARTSQRTSGELFWNGQPRSPTTASLKNRSNLKKWESSRTFPTTQKPPWPP